MMKILKASAGSGKTFALAGTYIEMLLSDTEPFPWRHILAVTFTNKATDEMKMRILKELHILSTSPEESDYYGRFVPALLPDGEALRKKASAMLSGILHDYGAFSVSTIDRFFQQTLKAFSREIGQFSSYQVELDKQSLVSESVDRILDSITEDSKALLEWLTDSVMEQVGRGERLRLEAPLTEMAVQIKSERFSQAVREGGLDIGKVFSRENLRALRRECDKVAKSFPAEVAKAASDVLKVFTAKGIEPKDTFKGFAKKLYDYAYLKEGELVSEPTPAFVQRASDSSKWFAASRDGLRLQLEGPLDDAFSAFLSLFGTSFKVYNTALTVRSQLYSLGIAAELEKEFEALQKEKNVLSLDDSNTILKDIIDCSDAPFVYEKLGVRYEHFLLDEFQDTSTIQWDNFRPLLQNSEAGGFRNLVVGDVKQSIYRWRGSDWHLLDRVLEEEFPGAEVSPLRGNYRTRGEIVEFNNGFFTYAAEKLSELLGEDPASAESVASIYSEVEQFVKTREIDLPGCVDAVFVDSEEDEMDEVVASVREVLGKGFAPGDIAVLVRGNKEGGEIARRFVDEGISVVSDDSLDINSSVTVRRLVSQLSLLDSPDGETPGVGGFLAREMSLEVPSEYYSLLDLCEGILRSLKGADGPVFEGELPYIQSFMDFVQDWSSVNGNNLRSFLQAWEKKELKISSPPSGSAVRVMTVHKSKGLEFPCVIVPFVEKTDLYKATRQWCRPKADGTALESLSGGIFNVLLSGKSESTLFGKDYSTELKLQAVDAVNVFYVALTRPRNVLKIISKRPDGEKLRNMADILWAYSSGNDIHIGEMVPPVRKGGQVQETIPLLWESWPCGTGRLAFSTDASDFFSDDGRTGVESSNRIRGIVLHDILSSVKVPGDLHAAVGRACSDGDLPESMRSGVEDFLEAEIRSVSSLGWFPDDPSAVMNEVSWIDTDGSVHRPDRVVTLPSRTIVIDYKFGGKEARYRRQVERYASILRRCGYPGVEARLWYIRPDSDDIIE